MAQSMVTGRSRAGTLFDWSVVTGARLMLTCGLPGAGKTSLARRLAADHPALRLTTDEWQIALGADPWDEDLRARLEREL